MLAGGREQRRISLLPFYLYTVLSKPASKARDAEIIFDEAFAAEIDFSGTGAYRAYKKLTNKAPKVTLSISNPHLTQQLLFHATFSTYVEDIGVLRL